MFVELDAGANKGKPSESFSVADSPPLQSCACWRRYVNECRNERF